MTEKQSQQLIEAIEDLTREIGALNNGEIYGGTLVDAINYLAENLNKK